MAVKNRSSRRKAALKAKQRRRAARRFGVAKVRKVGGRQKAVRVGSVHPH